MGQGRDQRSVRLAEIVEHVGGRILGEGDILLTGASSLEEAGPGDLAFVAADRFLSAARTSRAAAFLVGRPLEGLHAPQVVVENPPHAFAQLVQHFFVAPVSPRGVADQITRGAEVTIGEGCSIWPFVTLGDRVRVGARVTLYPGVFIGDDSVVGEESILYPNVTLREGTVIGCRVIIHSGTVVGSDGFGYVQHQGRHWKVPQIGTVNIEDDVEIGANVTVDRATFGRTLIKRGTKIDNLVQIAHNVTIGEDTILVAQVGIAGSTTVGHHVMVGGQAGIADHLTVGDQVLIAARSGVIRSVEPGQILSGAPALPHGESLMSQAVVPRLPEMRQQLRTLQQRVQSLERLVRASRRQPKARKK